MEIKFRAWDTKDRWMLDSSYGDWISYSGLSYTEADRKYNTPNTEIQRGENRILMQFSTLQDYSNPKKDIFTGDILTIAGHPDIPDGNYPVIFAEGSFCVDTPESTPTLFDVLMATTDVFVAGNIYQNEDLLTHKK